MVNGNMEEDHLKTCDMTCYECKWSIFPTDINERSPKGVFLDVSTMRKYTIGPKCYFLVWPNWEVSDPLENDRMPGECFINLGEQDSTTRSHVYSYSPNILCPYTIF
jgi:hypothetical protein